MKTYFRAGSLLLLLLLLTAGALLGCGNANQPEAPVVVEPGELTPQDADPEAPRGEAVTVTLYFSDDQASAVIAEQRAIELKDDSDEALAAAILNELIAGPRSEGLYRTMPDKSAVLGVEIKDGLATVNMSSEFQTGHNGGSAGEYITLASIANSLTELAVVREVQILIDGEKTDSLAGHFDLSEPLLRDEEFIKP